jgi:phosphoglucomutase/phosphomannomutase
MIETVRDGFGRIDVPRDFRDSALAALAAWLDDPALAVYRPYIERLVAAGAFGELLDSFWRIIPFGTGGRRGPVGVGPNRINPHTISLSVQGHCEYLREVAGAGGSAGVVVAYDVRTFYDLRGRYPGVDGVLKELSSRDLARMCAEVYAANGIRVTVVGPLADEGEGARPPARYLSTPELSFLIRELGAAGGLNISASHNHPDDNGGKFYNREGGQEIPPNDELLLAAVEGVAGVRAMPYAEARRRGLIRFVDPELHARYLAVNAALCPTPSRSARVAYTPLCGTGMTTVREALDRLGFEVALVPEQAEYDGSFASVRYRIGNPEVPESMDRLAAVARESSCHVGFATDPDADRLGMIVPDGQGGFEPVGGNEIGVLIIESALAARRRQGTLPARPIFINTLVSSGLQREIARRYGCQIVGDLMVGFKYMADVLGCIERAGRYPEGGPIPGKDSVEGTLADFVFTTEESHGYLLTPRVRDKDACGAAIHLAGLASELLDAGRTFRGYLRDIYRVYGYQRNALRSLVMEGIVGLGRMRRIQEALRAAPPAEIAGLPVARFVDNQVVGGPLVSTTDAANRNVLLFALDGGEGRAIRLVVRPSGTEPKTKIYVEVPARRCLGGVLADAAPARLAEYADADLDRDIAEADAEARRVGDAFIRFCLGPDVLGGAYPAIPDAALLVSDLVPVDHKIRVAVELLPELGRRARAGEDAAALGGFLDGALAPLGRDARGLIRKAALAWIDDELGALRLGAEPATALRSLFG